MISNILFWSIISISILVAIFAISVLGYGAFKSKDNILRGIFFGTIGFTILCIAFGLFRFMGL